MKDKEKRLALWGLLIVLSLALACQLYYAYYVALSDKRLEDTGKPAPMAEEVMRQYGPKDELAGEK
jgi:hypothetical protein